MGRYEYDEPKPDDPCERCRADLAQTDWAKLRAVHDGPSASGYRDAEKRVCVDCLAALGMLEFEMNGGSGGGQRTV
ncbi:hypothetical protein Halru_0045 [Halovivax ruber XH-70]|uniref:Uncharacterized protein n=1 Tax=Halovivax ruber (strain DSM 18193 / JCM 13892 / XH-70) TaxID=797302 RepID=L0I7N0_HALRX|nr:hypothetical protein [Halovivax ruber]AGB14699.1 hypothetical protein Halru_0045 [Halovivax ruber XH-70]